MARMGRRAECLRCGGDASAGMPRYQVADVSNGGRRPVGFLCHQCGQILEAGDVLTFDDDLTEYPLVTATPAAMKSKGAIPNDLAFR